MSMKMILVSLTALALLSWSCNDIAQRYPVQGKWKVEDMRYRREGKPDSLVTSGLGFLLFYECSEDSNAYYTCTAKRIHDNGKTERFNYGTRIDSHQRGDTRRLVMAQLARKEGDNEMEDLQGQFAIEVLIENQMVLSCLDCNMEGVEERLIKFELRATKVQE